MRRSVLNKLVSMIPCITAVACLLAFGGDFTDITEGMSEKDVAAALGKPKGKMKSGDSTVWIYEAGEITFKTGVVQVTDSISRPAPSASDGGTSPQPAPAVIVVVTTTATTTTTTTKRGPTPLESLTSGLKNEYSTSSSSSRIRCNLRTQMPMSALVSEAALNAFKSKGVTPFTVTASVSAYIANMARGKVVSGECLVRIFDGAGNQVKEAHVPLVDMEGGGYSGEVSTEGVYTAVVTYTHPGHSEIGDVSRCKLAVSEKTWSRGRVTNTGGTSDGQSGKRSERPQQRQPMRGGGGRPSP